MPRFWVFLAERWLNLPTSLASAWWNALRKSSWSSAQALRRAVWAYEAEAFKPQRNHDALQELIEPRPLLAGVEDLLHQHLLLRRDARQIEEAILDSLDRTGNWKGGADV